jgi:ABC-type uncharacterized transport system substrate-binding protein
VKRRVFALLAGSAAFARPPVASAQQSARTYRIGILSLLDAENTTSMKWLVERLLAAGYEQERNLVIGFRSASGQPERLQPLAAELVALRPDVLAEGTTLASVRVPLPTRGHRLPLGGCGGVAPSRSSGYAVNSSRTRTMQAS